ISKSESRVTRVFPNRWQYSKARWILSQPAVAAMNPHVLEWDDERLFYSEEYVSGETIAVRNLSSAVASIKELWPRIAALHQSRCVVRPLSPPKSRHSEAARELLTAFGLDNSWERAHTVPVRQGLVHGDLKPLNIL